MRHEALTLLLRRKGKIKKMESKNGIIFHSIVLREGDKALPCIIKNRYFCG